MTQRLDTDLLLSVAGLAGAPAAAMTGHLLGVLLYLSTMWTTLSQAQGK